MRYLLFIVLIFLSLSLKADNFNNPIENFFHMHGKAYECEMMGLLPVKTKTYVDKLLPLDFIDYGYTDTGILNKELKKMQGYTFYDLFSGEKKNPKVFDKHLEGASEIMDMYGDEFSLKINCEMMLGFYFLGMSHLYDLLNESLEDNLSK